MIDKKLIEAAKLELKRLKMSPADCELSKKYPKHTLEAARMIDAVQAARPPLPDHVIHDCGEDFKFLQWQESGTPYTRQ